MNIILILPKTVCLFPVTSPESFWFFHLKIIWMYPLVCDAARSFITVVYVQLYVV